MRIYDFIVVGGGPAALSEALRLDRRRANVLVISERYGGCLELLGDQLLQSYVPELLIAGAPVALQDYVPKTSHSPTGREYAAYIRDCFLRLDVTRLTARVASLQKEGDYLCLRTADGAHGVLHGRNVILATGIRPRCPDPRLPRDNLETCFEAYRDIERRRLDGFRGRNVCILGSGNTAYQLARHLSRVAREITLLVTRYVGVYPFESADRFALRAPSVPAIELILKSANGGGSTGPLNPEWKTLCPVWLHVYDDLQYELSSRTLLARIPEALNRPPVAQASVTAAASAGLLERDGDGYLWRRSLDDTTVISAIGLRADAPSLPWPGLVDESTGFFRHANGRTSVEGLYVAGAAAGYASVNFMRPVALSEELGSLAGWAASVPLVQ